MRRLCAGQEKFFRKALNKFIKLKNPVPLIPDKVIERKKEYGLLAAVNKGLIPCLADGGMSGLAEDLNPNGFNETCNWHSIQRLGLNARETCLKIFDEKQDEKMEKILKFCDRANKDLSKKDIKKKGMLPTHAKGINSYFDGLELKDEDRSRICRYSRPNGWKAEFDDAGAELSDGDKKLKQKLISSKTVFPKIKVYKHAFHGFSGLCGIHT